ncbi:Protein of unknown function [Pseudomonas pohangensis]|uniref:Conjugative relaxase domain-containing protein, TrwC/TraI family n=1 Tax=Pseudomonas pohangensis TaxID=364197 RepID=A0A1H2G2T2_9PSED|nr:AAA family ATPase [Pseudomonas pohangensis]SDU13871.1 Protein of unknown function [Pseudomonas pohangensis]
MSHYGFAGSKTTARNFAERASYYEKKLGEMRALQEQRIALGEDVSVLTEEIAQADALLAVALGDLEDEAKSGREDYFFKMGADTLDSQISGPLAERLGLGSEPQPGDYMALYRGINPRTSEIYLEKTRSDAIENDIAKAEIEKAAKREAKNSGEGVESIRLTLAEADVGDKKEQVLGHSSCVSLQKSLSMYWATAPEQERVIIQEALLQAVTDAGNYEQARGYVGGRLGAGGSEFVAGEGMVLEYLHCTSRVEKGHERPDPQLHVHRERPNVVRLPGGAMRTLDGGELYKRQKEFGAVVDVALASKLQQRLPHLAAALEVDHAGHGLKLNEGTISRERVLGSSKRGQGITAKAVELGMDGAAATEAIAVRGRSSKQEEVGEDIFDHWRDEIGEIELVQSSTQELTMPTILQVQEMLFKGSSVISDHHLDFVAAQLTIGKGGIEQIALTREALIKQLCIVEIPPRFDENGELVRGGKKYTTGEMIRIESDCLKAAVAGMENERWAINPELVESIIQRYELEKQATQKPEDRRFRLTDEQREAAFKLTGNGQYNFLQGAAGVGKSATLAPVFRAFGEAFAAKGHRCIGVAPQNKQASELEKSTGIKSRTVHSLLMNHEKAAEAQAKGERFNPQNLVQPCDVIVCDEAGTLDTFTLHALVSVCQDRQAKLVMVGDRRQMESVGTAPMFGLLSDAMGGNLARIESIARQKEEFKPVAQALYEGKIPQALKAMESKDQIRIFREDVNEADELVKAALADAQTARKGWEDLLILADTNAQVGSLNDKFRDKLIADGSLDPEKQIEIETVDLQGYARALSVTPGDRLLLRKNAKDAEKLPVSNGDLGTVLSVREIVEIIDEKEVRDIELMIRRDDGETARIRNSEYQAIQHGWAMTTTKCQGMTVDRSYYLPSDMTHMRALYVAYTRGREGGFVYANETRWAEIKKGVERFSEKETALSLMPAMRQSIEAAAQTNQKLVLTAQAVTVEGRLSKGGERFQMPGQTPEPESPDRKIQVIPNAPDDIERAKALGKTIVTEDQLCDPKFELPDDGRAVAVALNPAPPIPAVQDTELKKATVTYLPTPENRGHSANLLDRMQSAAPLVNRTKYFMPEPMEANHEKTRHAGSLTRSERVNRRTERSAAAGSGDSRVSGSLGTYERDITPRVSEARFQTVANLGRPVGFPPQDGMRRLSERSLAPDSGMGREGLLPGNALADRQPSAGVRRSIHPDAVKQEKPVSDKPRKYPIDKAGAQRETDGMKRNVDLVGYAQHLGYEVDKTASYKGHTVVRGHGEAKIDIYAGKDGNWAWSDRKSGKGGDIFKLKQFTDGGDFKVAKDDVREYLAAPTPVALQKTVAPSVEQPKEKAERIEQGTAKAKRDLEFMGRNDAYLRSRGLSAETLDETRWKSNRYGSATFSHVGADGKACGYEYRGESAKGFSKDTEKGVYVANKTITNPTEIRFCEGGVDTLSAYQLATPEERQTILFVGTAVQTGENTEKAIIALAQRNNIQKFSTLYNQDQAGDNLTAQRHERLAQQFPDAQITDLRDEVGLQKGEDMNLLLNRLNREALELEKSQQLAAQAAPEPAHAEKKAEPTQDAQKPEEQDQNPAKGKAADSAAEPDPDEPTQSRGRSM